MIKERSQQYALTRRADRSLPTYIRIIWVRIAASPIIYNDRAFPDVDPRSQFDKLLRIKAIIHHASSAQRFLMGNITHRQKGYCW